MQNKPCLVLKILKWQHCAHHRNLKWTMQLLRNKDPQQKNPLQVRPCNGADISELQAQAYPEGGKGAMSPQKFLEHIVILCFDRRFSKQNSVFCLKSDILAPPKFLDWLCHWLQAHYCMTPRPQTWFLCSVSVLQANKLSLQELNQLIEIELLT